MKAVIEKIDWMSKFDVELFRGGLFKDYEDDRSTSEVHCHNLILYVTVFDFRKLEVYYQEFILLELQNGGYVFSCELYLYIFCDSSICSILEISC